MIVALIGFWDWRSALLMALSIPLTLAHDLRDDCRSLGIDLQQVSIASLIIALGLLVDDAGGGGRCDQARARATGSRAIIAALARARRKLAKAILFATITNIVAYLPFLLLHG